MQLSSVWDHVRIAADSNKAGHLGPDGTQQHCVYVCVRVCGGLCCAEAPTIQAQGHCFAFVIALTLSYRDEAVHCSDHTHTHKTCLNTVLKASCSNAGVQNVTSPQSRACTLEMLAS